MEILKGDRRADVMTWHSDSGQAIAIELQHSTIDLDIIESRAQSYASARIAQFWIGFLGKNAKDKAYLDGKDRWKIEQYSVRPFENWISGFNLGNGSWMYDPFEGCFWNCEFSDHHIWVEDNKRYDEFGEEHDHGGYLPLRYHGATARIIVKCRQTAAALDDLGGTTRRQSTPSKRASNCVWLSDTVPPDIAG